MNNIHSIPATLPPSHFNQIQQQESPTNSLDFGQILQDSIRMVDESQKTAETMTQQLITGETDDLHAVTIAAQQANLTLQLTVQVRNKVVEAYEEIMRMQV